MALIQITDLTFAYPGSFDNVFEHVSFQFDTDWRLGLTGRNGRGKTTFLKLLDGRAPDKVINSCGSGVNASANLFAMDLSGLYGSKLYVGSWSQWIDDDANPVATGK